MKILIACEYSGVVRDAFIAKGHEAISCDLRPTDNPGPHIQDDVLNHLDEGWDMMIAHPYCTFNCLSGIRWMYHPEDTHLPAEERRRHPQYPNRMKDFEEGAKFFLKLANAKIDKIAIENSQPHGLAMAKFGRYTQKVQPWMFGDPVTKGAYLWLKGLPLLTSTHKKPNVIAAVCHHMPPGKDRIGRKSVVEQTKPSQTQWPNNGVEMYWNDYHMGFAKHAALKSKDSTQVGAVAIGLHKQVVETGFNGPPRGVLDSPERRERPAKYLFAAHAEANLVATAARARLEGTTVYVTHFCCSGCAKSLIQAGVSRVVVGDGVTSMPDEEFEAASAMFAEAGVVVERLGGPDE